MPELSSYSVEDACRRVPGTTLELILKVTERCNLACSYCYFFFGGDDSYARRPAVMSDAVFADTLAFVVDAVEQFGIESVQIDFHGGEPMLLKPERFDQMCTAFETALAGRATVTFVMQTNAVLVDERWIDLFGRHNVHVGVSIDGPAEDNDRYRVDKKGRATHARVVRGIEAMQAGHRAGRMGNIAALCVLDAETDIDTFWNHIVTDLGFRSLNVLLPDVRGISYGPTVPARTAPKLARLVELWLRDPEVDLTFLRSPFSRLTAGPAYDPDAALFQHLKAQIYTVFSNGEIGPDDSLRPLAPDLFETGLNVSDHTLADVLRHPRFASFAVESHQPPGACQACCWRHLCRGGEMAHRDDGSGGFATPSAYCDGLADMYASLAARAVEQGSGLHQIAARLGLDADEWRAEAATQPVLVPG